MLTRNEHIRKEVDAMPEVWRNKTGRPVALPINPPEKGWSRIVPAFRYIELVDLLVCRMEMNLRTFGHMQRVFSRSKAQALNLTGAEFRKSTGLLATFFGADIVVDNEIPDTSIRFLSGETPNTPRGWRVVRLLVDWEAPGCEAELGTFLGGSSPISPCQ